MDTPNALTVTVCDPQLRQTNLESYEIYKVVTTLHGETRESTRRFGDFHFLHSLLRSRIPGAIIPTLPAKGVKSTVAHSGEFVAIRTKALDAYMKLLISNGESLKEIESVHKAIEVFLTGSERAWTDIKDLAKSPDLTNSLDKSSADKSETRDRGFSSFGEAAGVVDDGSDDEGESSPATNDADKATEESGGEAPKKSTFGFMSKMSMPTMSGLKSMISAPEKTRADEKTSDDIKLDKIAIEVRDQLAKIVDADRKANALISVDRVSFWTAVAYKAGEIKKGFVPTELESGPSGERMSEADVGADDAKKNKAALVYAAQVEGEQFLKPLDILLHNHRHTLVPTATGQFERRVLCLEPIVNHIMVLQSVKAALQLRVNVRKEWAKTVTIHASKKAALQRAYDNPKTTSEYRLELEEIVDQATTRMNAAEDRLHASTKRFGRDYERFLIQKEGTMKEFMFVWAKIHSALAKSMMCDLDILHADISKCPGGSYLDGDLYTPPVAQDISASEAQRLFNPSTTAPAAEEPEEKAQESQGLNAFQEAEKEAAVKKAQKAAQAAEEAQKAAQAAQAAEEAQKAAQAEEVDKPDAAPTSEAIKPETPVTTPPGDIFSGEIRPSEAAV